MYVIKVIRYLHPDPIHSERSPDFFSWDVISARLVASEVELGGPARRLGGSRCSGSRKAGLVSLWLKPSAEKDVTGLRTEAHP
jgi:hypothetical protein